MSAASAPSVKGPVATMTMPSFGISSMRAVRTQIFGCEETASVTAFAYPMRSTARAPPAGTL